MPASRLQPDEVTMKAQVRAYLTLCPYCHREVSDLLLDRHIAEVHRYRLCLDAEDVRQVDPASPNLDQNEAA